MGYMIYFDESNKLDQPHGGYSYYGAFGVNISTIEKKVEILERINRNTESKNEMHFVDYTSDTYFEKYFKSLCHVINEEISINIMIVNNKDAKKIADTISITMTELRELFYVKIPERLFYGMTRRLENKETIRIVIDENDEYVKLDLQRKLEEQMNAHSAYRNKGYKVDKVEQLTSHESMPLQIVDTFIGIVVYIMEKQFSIISRNNDNVTLKVKSDLIYRFLIHQNNIELFQNKINLYKWEGNVEEMIELKLSDSLSSFIIDKTQHDIQQMNKLERIRIEEPGRTTKYYREKMGYTNQELKTIQGYINELDGKGRNSYFTKDRIVKPN